MSLTFVVSQPAGNFQPNFTLAIYDIGSANISVPSFSILQVVSSRPHAFSPSKSLNILKTSSLLDNLSLKNLMVHLGLNSTPLQNLCQRYFLRLEIDLLNL